MELHGSTFDIKTVVTVMATVIVVTEVKVERNKHVCKTLQQFVSAIGFVKDLVGRWSVPCSPLFRLVFCTCYTEDLILHSKVCTQYS